MNDDVANDPNRAERNLRGHLVTCNYGDWLDFTKCECAEELIGVPEKRVDYHVAPMSMRDYFAASIVVSDEAAHSLATNIKRKEASSAMITDAMGMAAAREPLSIMDIASARARIRYLEADIMLDWRNQTKSRQIEAEKILKDDWLCVCGHAPMNHEAMHRNKHEVESGACNECNCSNYVKRPVMPANASDD